MPLNMHLNRRHMEILHIDIDIRQRLNLNLQIFEFLVDLFMFFRDIPGSRTFCH